jgi:predicted  nucleic acid-binding Zn-ribbon protein
MEPPFDERSKQEKQMQKRKMSELEDEIISLKDANVLSYKNERFLFGLFEKEKRQRKKLEDQLVEVKQREKRHKKYFEEECQRLNYERKKFDEERQRFYEERQKFYEEHKKKETQILEETKRLETERNLWISTEERYLNAFKMFEPSVVDLSEE